MKVCTTSPQFKIGHLGLILILFVFVSTETENAANALNGRWFGGRVIKAEGYDEIKFGAGDLSG